MAKGHKERIIDVSKKELLSDVDISESTFDVWIKRFLQIYSINEKEINYLKNDPQNNNSEYEFKWEWYPLFKVLFSSMKYHPFFRRNRKIENIKADDLKRYYEKLLEEVDDLPDHIKYEVTSHQTYRNTLKEKEILPDLANKLTEFISAMEIITHQERPDIMRAIYKQLDDWIYSAFINNDSFNLVKESNKSLIPELMTEDIMNENNHEKEGKREYLHQAELDELIYTAFINNDIANMVKESNKSQITEPMTEDSIQENTHEEERIRESLNQIEQYDNSRKIAQDDSKSQITEPISKELLKQILSVEEENQEYLAHEELDQYIAHILKDRMLNWYDENSAIEDKELEKAASPYFGGILPETDGDFKKEILRSFYDMGMAGSYILDRAKVEQTKKINSEIKKYEYKNQTKVESIRQHQNKQKNMTQQECEQQVLDAKEKARKFLNQKIEECQKQIEDCKEMLIELENHSGYLEERTRVKSEQLERYLQLYEEVKRHSEQYQDAAQSFVGRIVAPSFIVNE